MADSPTDPNMRRWRLMRRGAFALGLVSGMSRAVSGQGTGPIGSPVGSPLSSATPSSQQLTAVTVAPGDSALRAQRLAAGTQVFALTLFRDGDEIPVGRLRDVLVHDSSAAAPVLRRTLTTERGTLQLTDSTDSAEPGLAPLRRRSQQQNRRVLLEFVGRRVRGSLAPQDVPGVPIDTTLPVAAFDAGNWDLVLRALPLAVGYAAQFAAYDVDAGVRRYQVQVTGQTTLHGEAAWVVKLVIGRGRESYVWIGKETARLLQLETMLNESTMLRQVLLPATTERAR
ncbi:MAG: hypothetical protein K2Y26_09450 [Gemmatimonadaceae bacterium]|jgi:hypothetical protein|nr:hypothetical protein [Gemmatimonadaceae bacterium]MBX9855742.1 hypothetical protein [Gemmatimonadaceae bacterium]